MGDEAEAKTEEKHPVLRILAASVPAIASAIGAMIGIRLGWNWDRLRLQAAAAVALLMVMEPVAQAVNSLIDPATRRCDADQKRCVRKFLGLQACHAIAGAAAFAAVTVPALAHGPHPAPVSAVLSVCAVSAASNLTRGRRNALRNDFRGRRLFGRHNPARVAMGDWNSNFPNLQFKLLAPDGSLRDSRAAQLITAALAALVISVWIQNDSPNESEVLVYVSRWVQAELTGEPGPDPPQEPRVPAGSPPPTDPGAPVRTGTPCGSRARLEKSLARVEPVTARTALVREFERFGEPFLGCPQRTQVMGEFWVADAQTPDGLAMVVVGPVGPAAFVDAFARTAVRSRLPDLSRVDQRVRWGLGTMQLLRGLSGDCRLVQRRDNATDATVVPPAVTAIAAVIASRADGFPVVVPTDPSTWSITVVTRAQTPLDADGLAIAAPVSVRYAAGVASGSDMSVHDRAACPVEVDALTAAARSLERQRQRSA